MVVILICLLPVTIAAGIAVLLHRRIRPPKFRKLVEKNNRNSTALVENYNTYTMSLFESFRYTIMAAAVLAITGYLFFRNPYICFFICLLSLVYPKIRRKSIIRKRKNELCLQFRDALQAISASLSAGRSIESSFKAAVEDLKILYPDKNTLIIKELELINRKVDMNETLRNALADFAERARVEDINNFVEVFGICSSTGGNLVDVIKNTTGVISQKIDIMGEIDVIVAEQRFSQRILNIMPFGLLGVIIISSPDYIQPLYTPKGNVVMLIVLALLLLSYYIGDRIMDIKV